MAIKYPTQPLNILTYSGDIVALVTRIHIKFNKQH